jgi:tripartite-type tricarboxylate transporter receptor subunit TctC
MRKLFCAAAAVAAISSAITGLTGAASAQTFPSRPITLLVPFPPGGVIDTTARVIETDLGKELGQPVVIENKGGSGGNCVFRKIPDTVFGNSRTAISVIPGQGFR